MISNELLKKKILDSAIRGELVENDLSLPPVDVEEIKEDIPFEIPNNWRCCCLGCVATCKTGNSINEKEKKDKFSDMFVEGLYYVATKDISTNSIIKYENGIKIPFNLVEKFKIAEKDSILLCIEGGSAGKKIGFTTKDICFVNKLCNISSKVINNKFIYYFIQTNFFYKQFESKKTGIIGGVSIKNIENLIIFVPPLEEQEKIVKKIDELFELVDKKEKNDKEKDKLKTLLKEKILDSAIRGELVENYLSLPTVDVEKIKENVPFNIPNNWKWSNFEYITTKISDGAHSTPKYVSNGIPFLSVKDISNGNISFENCKYISEEQHKVLYSRCDPKYGDLLITKVGTTGVPVVVDTNIEFSLFVSVAMLRFDENKIYNKYIKYATLSKLIQSQIDENTRGAANKNWVIKDIKKTIIPIPPLEQQKKIVEKIEKCFELIEQL